MRFTLMVAVLCLAGCGKSEPPPQPKPSTKTKAEKADAMLRNVTGKQETSGGRLQDSINQQQQKALDQIEQMESK